MDKIKDNNGRYYVAVLGMDRSKTSSYQELRIYPEIKLILYNWYWFMSYTCVMDHANKKFIFPILPAKYSIQMRPG